MTNEKRLNGRDRLLMERLMLMKQGQAQKFLSQALAQYYSADNLIITNEYIGAKGDIPIAVAAHMDTVWETSVGHEVFYDRKKNVMVNLRGGGYDDKVGCFMILKLLEFGYRPHVIFCANEEIGSLGADSFVKDYPDCPFDDCRFIVMLDRRGKEDCVFYDCDNLEFEKYCESFGFKTAWGSFTDICTLCPAWKMAGVNFSVGYVDEHTPNEKLFVGHMFDTLNKVENILSQSKDKIPYFNYIPSAYSYGYHFSNPTTYYGVKQDDYNRGWFYDEDICWGCGKELATTPKGVVRFIDDDGYEISFCADCANKYVDYCEICGQPFEKDETHPDQHFCMNCQLDMLGRKFEG